MGLAQRRGDAENARSLSLRLSVSGRNHALRNRTGMPQDQRPNRLRGVRGAGGGGVLGAGEDGEGVWPRSIDFQPVREGTTKARRHEEDSLCVGAFVVMRYLDGTRAET